MGRRESRNRGPRSYCAGASEGGGKAVSWSFRECAASFAVTHTRYREYDKKRKRRYGSEKEGVIKGSSWNRADIKVLVIPQTVDAWLVWQRMVGRYGWD